MRVCLLLENCDYESISDFKSFTDMLIEKEQSLGNEFKFSTPKQMQQQACEIAKNSGNHTCFAIFIDLKEPLSKIATAQMNGPSLSQTIWEEGNVIHWQIHKLTYCYPEYINGNEYLLESIKEVNKMQHKEWQPNRKKAWPIVGAVVGLGLGIALGMSISAIVAIGAAFTGISYLAQRVREHFILKSYPNIDKIITILNPYEKEAMNIGKDCTDWNTYIQAFKKPVTWSHPIAFTSGMAIGTATHPDQKLIDAIEFSRPHKPKS